VRAALANLIVLLAAASLALTTRHWARAHGAPGAAFGPGLLILIGGVLAAYALDRFLDAPDRAARRARLTPAALSVAVGAALIADGLALAPRHLPLTCALAALAAAYIPIKRWVPKGLPNALAWGAATVWLPLDAPLRPAGAAPLALAVALTVLANAILCDTLDIDADRAAGVKSLAVWLGPRSARAAAATAALCASAAALAAGAAPLLAATLPLTAAAALMRPRNRAAQRLALDAMILTPGLFILLLQTPAPT